MSFPSEKILCRKPYQEQSEAQNNVPNIQAKDHVSTNDSSIRSTHRDQTNFIILGTNASQKYSF